MTGGLPYDIPPELTGDNVAYAPADAMRATVRNFRGEINFEMIQGSSTSYGLINMDESMRNGACKAFCYQWMRCHKAGESFQQYILKPTGVKKIKALQAEEATSAGSTFDTDWERPKRIMQEMGFVAVGGGMNQIQPVRGDAIAAELLTTPGYKLLSIRGNAGGHAICGYVADEEAVLFDPNCGEAQFFSKQNLAYWFTDFWNNCDFYKLNLGNYCLVRTYR
jgi:hypothetical protein